MALFVALRRLGVTQHPALWSPDFPLAAETFASDCLASFGGDFTACAIQTANDLLLARVEDAHMHFLAKRGMSLGKLHEANYLQKSDAVHGAELGFVIGGLGGFLIGIYIYLTPPDGVTLQLVTVLIGTAIGAVFGAWAASLVAMSVPNTRLKPFQKDIDAGKILLMVDVPTSRVEELRELVSRRHPEAMAHGIEPTIPAFP